MVECSQCGKVFKYESERRRHELSHLKDFGCDKCGKKFTYLSALRRHQKQHERTGNIQCDQCYHSFKDETLLKRHIKYAHEGIHNCSECNAEFNSNQALRIHILTHKPKSERKYVCSFNNCNKTFNFSHHLKYHEMTHTNIKQHFCKTCGKGFIQAYNLKVHMKVHEPSKWLPCEIINCKKKFVSEYARKRHQARHKKSEKKEILPNLVLNMTVSTKDTKSSISKPSSTILHKHQINDTTKESEVAKKITINLSDEKQNHVVLNDFKEDEEMVNCKSILGVCLATGDTSRSENCICDQMIKSNDHCSEKNEAKIITGIKERLSPTYKDDAKKSTCEDCSCNSVQTNARNIKKHGFKNMKVNINNNCLPQFEYGLNGTVKVINTVDIEFEGIIRTDENNKITNNNFSRQIHDIQDIPYNSCKAVLGKCIVSGNGMINEDCLCAKMAMEEQEMTSQEIEEITPQFNDSNMCY